MKAERLPALGVWWAGLLAVAVLALYLPSLRYGLIWDDPLWYRQGAGQSLWQLFTALPTYQFYRPLAIWLNRQFVSPEGLIHAQALHALQIGAHLVSTLLCVPALQAAGLAHWPARLGGLFFALFPMGFQAVAWQAPQGPLLVAWLLLAILAAHRFQRSQHVRWLLASLGAYGVALLFQESALPFVFVFFWLAARDWPRRRRWPWLHLVLAVAYTLLWLNVPRQSGVTGQGFQINVLAYLLQGVTFPMARLIAVWASGWTVEALTTLFALIIGLLVLGLWRAGEGRAALFSALWIGAGLLPVWAGLAWDYVYIGERLLYVAAPGIAALWAGWAAWSFSAAPRWRRAWGGLVLLGVLLVSLQHLVEFQRLYAAGTAHLQQAVSALAARPGQRVLFINFPDRFELRPPRYPLGFWGVTLAPPVVHLADFARAQTGRSADDESLAAFLTGADERAAWRYRVDMRGVNSAPQVLWEAAQRADVVYLSEYEPGGTLHLREVGSVRPAASGAYRARFADQAQLVDAELMRGERVSLRLVWRALKPFGYEETIFVHLWRGAEFVISQDGDSLGELIPLWAWQPGWEIVDVREIDTRGLPPGEYELRVGLYRRGDGSRLEAASPAGQRVPDDAVSVGTFHLP